MRLLTIVKGLSILALSSAVIALSVDVKANATTLSFDDVTTGSNALISNGYGGLNWNNMFVLDGRSAPNTGYDRGRVSGNYVAFNGFGTPASVTSSTAFNFNSAYLTGAWRDNLSVQVDALSGGIMKYSKTVMVNTTAAQLFNFDFIGIDQLQFSSFGGTTSPGVPNNGTQFAMDNFTFNEPIASVPEPFTVVGTLIGGTAAFRLRKKLKANPK